MISILLCCEGPGDQGKKEYIDGEYIYADGVMQVLIRNFFGGGDDIRFIVKRRQDIMAISIRKKYLSKQEITSQRLALMAKKEMCSHIAYHRDEDNKGFSEMYLQIQGYFEDLKARGFSCLAIIPMHMTESWLLSDEGAFEKLSASKLKKSVLPSKPEKMWGNKGTDKHPKKYLEKVLEQYHLPVSYAIYADIAEHSDIEILKRRCPISFTQFYADMQSFISNGEETHEN